jgi:hypothetical protein
MEAGWAVAAGPRGGEGGGSWRPAKEGKGGGGLPESGPWPSAGPSSREKGGKVDWKES